MGQHGFRVARIISQRSMLEPVPRQPSGTVAFLFSDIEASTRRWERYGDSMRDAVRRHDRILRSEIERWRGYIFKTIGDAFCAAFWTASDALGAAVEVQRRLGRENFVAVDGLSVRMAIHIGEADERDGDYSGAPSSKNPHQPDNEGIYHPAKVVVRRSRTCLRLRRVPYR